MTLVEPDESYFRATHQGTEIDLVLRKNGRWLGMECKRTDAPRMTRSMTTALDDLHLEKIVVIYPGQKRFPIGSSVEAVPFQILQGETDTSILAVLF